MRHSEQIPEALDGERLDRVVSMIADCSRSAATKWIEDGAVQIHGRVVSKRAHRVSVGDQIEIEEPEESRETVDADRSVDVVVVHEDPDFIVVNKSPGVVVHPGAGNRQGTLVNGLLARYGELATVGEPDRPGIVHRLDKGTSGLLVVARTQVAYQRLVEAFSNQEVERHYDTLVQGHCESDSGVVDAPIARSSGDATKMTVSSQGRPARTRYEVVARYAEPASFTRLACRLETGRTHQIRVHLSAIGHPVVGDGPYGGVTEKVALPRPFLHAEQLKFAHPVTGEPLSFEVSLPRDLRAVLDALVPVADG